MKIFHKKNVLLAASYANGELEQSLAAALPPRYEQEFLVKKYEYGPSTTTYEYEQLEAMYMYGPLEKRNEQEPSVKKHEDWPPLEENEHSGKKDDLKMLELETHEKWVRMYKLVCADNNYDTSFVPVMNKYYLCLYCTYLRIF